MSDGSIRNSRPTTVAWMGLILVCGLVGTWLPAVAGAQVQQTFDSPQAALDALKAAVQEKDQAALRKLFGPQVDQLKSGDSVQDAADMVTFARRLKVAARLEPAGEARVTVLVGPDEHPFPVPIVQKDGKWLFDTAAGEDEIENRRIGENELRAISVCRGYVAAQREYYQADRAPDEVPEFARRMASTPGRHDGLYWATKPDEPPSPLGPLVAQAQSEGYMAAASTRPAATRPAGPRPYHGYVYKILTRQGKDAPGGAYDYVINGHMVAGFALVAYPVSWGSSGVMTFLVGPNGSVYEKDLGEKTAELAGQLAVFSPDDTWKLSGQ